MRGASYSLGGYIRGVNLHLRERGLLGDLTMPCLLAHASRVSSKHSRALRYTVLKVSFD